LLQDEMAGRLRASLGETAQRFPDEAKGFTELASAQVASDGSLPSTVGDVSVVIDGKLAQMLYSMLGQAGAVLPQSIRGGAKLQIGFLGLTSNEVFLPVAVASPGIFTASGGTGQAVMVNANTGPLNSSAEPAARGEIVTLFATGMERRTPPARLLAVRVFWLATARRNCNLRE
jgi:uncharacterized protein (TIGR03437 family)